MRRLNSASPTRPRFSSWADWDCGRWKPPACRPEISTSRTICSTFAAPRAESPAELPLVFADVRQVLALWLSEPGRTQGDYLIAPERGPRRPLNQASVHRWFQRCCERAGLEGIKLHELRHSAGDRLWRETGDLIAAKDLLRHESVQTTEGYLHPTADDLRARMRESDK